jgi:hypothetical protein
MRYTASSRAVYRWGFETGEIRVFVSSCSSWGAKRNPWRRGSVTVNVADYFSASTVSIAVLKLLNGCAPSTVFRIFTAFAPEDVPIRNIGVPLMPSC